MARPIIKSLTIAAALCLGGVVSLAPLAQAHAEVPAISKIAMVDMQRVLNETEAGKRARKELEKSSTSKQTKLNKKRQALEAEAAKLASMSGQTLIDAQEKLQREGFELQNMMMALEQELAQQHDKLLEKMYRNAQSIVSEMAKAQGFDLVLVRDPMTVLYAQDGFDITDAVVKTYNSKHK